MKNKLLTTLLPFLLLAACAKPAENKNESMELAPGPEGTFLAIGSDLGSDLGGLSEGDLLQRSSDEFVIDEGARGQHEDEHDFAAPRDLDPIEGSGLVEEQNNAEPTQINDGIDAALQESGATAGRRTQPAARRTSTSRTGFDFSVRSSTPGLTIGTAVGSGGDAVRNESRMFIPASITKVVTAAAALKVLGPDFRFKTEVKWVAAGSGVAQDLTVIANGDPQGARNAISAGPERERIEQIARNLKEKGVRRVTGHLNLISADDRLDVALYPRGIMAEDRMACYGAVAQAFNFRWNCSGLSITGVGRSRWSDSDLDFPVEYEMTAGARHSLSATPQMDSIGKVVSYLIRGIFNTRSGRPVGVAAPVPNAKNWYGSALLSELTRQGVDVSGVTVRSLSGAEARSVARTMESQSSNSSFEILSDPASDLIRHMNKPSDNFLADALFKAVAVRHASRATDIREAGQLAIRDAIRGWMERNGHPEYAEEIVLHDGAGLSRDNRVSPRAFMAVMKEFSREPHFRHLWDSLPIAGRDGTLRGRMRGTRAQGAVHAKTGTLKGAYQLAGYIPRIGSDGRISEFVPFVILSDTRNESNRHRVRSFQDQLVARLMESINSGRGSAPVADPN